MISVPLVIAAELATVTVLALLAIYAVRRRRRADNAMKLITGSFEDTLAAVMPRRVARMLLFELHAWGALGRLVWRRPHRLDSAAFPYASDLALLMGVLLGLTVVETPVFLFLGAVLLPWLWLKVVLLVVDLYAVWFVASLWAGMVTCPHTLRGEALHLRVGLLAGMVIPLSEIESASLVQRHWPGFLGPLLQDATAAFAVAGSTEIVLLLSRRAAVWRLFGRDVAVSEVHVHADDSRRMLDTLSIAIAPASCQG